MDTFNSAEQKHVSSHGFVNFTPGGQGAVAKQIAAVFQRFPHAIIVDGDDDWGAPKQDRPETFAKSYGLTPLAYFHTGVSGITKSGIVVTPEDFQRIPVDVRTNPRLKIYQKP